MLPLPSTAIPEGRLNRAVLPAPSKLPLTPAEPARVVTTAPGVILRIVWLPVSPTYTLPALSNATPRGPEKRAATPVPSAAPGGPGEPAKVVTTPAAEILRTVLLSLSAT